MKRLFAILFLITLCVFQVYSQPEYRFFTIRFGLDHNALSPQPDAVNNLYIKHPDTDGTFKLFVPGTEGTDNNKYNYYGIGLTGGIYFNYDLKKNKLGFVLGAEFSNNSTGAKYVSNVGDYHLIEKYKVYSVGLPLMLKFGKNIYKNQGYFFAGIQYNINLKLNRTQTVSWDSNKSIRWLESDHLRKSNIVYCAGFNYLIFNFQLSYMPKTFLDRAYTEQKEENNDVTEIKPYAGQRGGLFSVKTTIRIPFSEWLLLKSWQAEQIRRKLKLN